MKGFLLIDANKNVLEIPAIMYERLIKLQVTPLEKQELQKAVKMCANRKELDAVITEYLKRKE